MRIAILGGTGDLGRGLTLRWAEKHEITIGSRIKEKAEALVEEYLRVAREDFGRDYDGKIQGEENREPLEGILAVSRFLTVAQAESWTCGLKPQRSLLTLQGNVG